MNKKAKRELLEWIMIIVVFGTLYFTGLHTEAIGRVQSLIVAVGIMQPDVLEESEQLEAAYNFKIMDVDGKVVDFNDFAGDAVFLNFWATWCAPCVAEMPDIHKLYKHVGSQDDISFAMISLDDDFETAKDFVKKRKYKFPIYQMVTSRPEIFRSQSIPTTFIISKEGKIMAKRAGMAKYNTEKVYRLLGANSSI